MEKRKIIMDCDPGIDDAIALAYAAAHPEAFDLLAVTTVAGNQTIEKVTRNALDLTALYKLNVPVAAGMVEPIVREPQTASEFHGKNGLGDCTIPKSDAEPVKEMAVFYIKKLLTELPEGEKVTLICTAPLTNIGILLKIYPEVKNKIQEIILMGGAIAGGNATASAEFNIYVDPEAARIVFKSGVPVVMCGLDVTEKCALTANQIRKLSQSDNNKVAKLCGDMTAYSLANGNKFRGKVSIHDAVPFMYLNHPEIFKIQKAVLDVDCSDGVSAGRTIADFRWWTYEEKDENIAVMDADAAKFQEYLIEAIYELGEKVK